MCILVSLFPMRADRNNIDRKIRKVDWLGMALVLASSTLIVVRGESTSNTPLRSPSLCDKLARLDMGGY